MNDDRDWSWMSHPQPAAPPTVERVLWTVVKDDRRAELRVQYHPLGQELRMLYDGGKGGDRCSGRKSANPVMAGARRRRRRAPARVCVRRWQVVEPGRSDHPPA